MFDNVYVTSLIFDFSVENSHVSNVPTNVWLLAFLLFPINDNEINFIFHIYIYKCGNLLSELAITIIIINYDNNNNNSKLPYKNSSLCPKKMINVVQNHLLSYQP